MALNKNVLCLFWWITCAVSMFSAVLVQAHELRPAVANISIVTGTATTTTSAIVSIRLNLEKLIAEIGPEHEDSETSPNQRHYNSLRAMSPPQLLEQYQRFLPTLIDGLKIQNGDNNPIAISNIEVQIPEVGQASIARDSTLTFALDITSTDQIMTWQWDRQFGEIILRADDDSGDVSFSAMVAGGQRSAEISLGATVTYSLFDTIRNYIVVGFQHILPRGLDHILFVIGIFLLTPRFKPLLVQVSIFTVAHTITLTLGSLKVLQVSPMVVEPLIAASIVYVCIENIFRHHAGESRLIIIFLFGLLHGLGFASVLNDFGLQVEHFIAALMSFNVGVELGQLFVIILCYLAFGLWFKKPWYRQRITLPASILIGLTGAVWFVQRVI